MNTGRRYQPYDPKPPILQVGRSDNFPVGLNSEDYDEAVELVRINALNGWRGAILRILDEGQWFGPYLCEAEDGNDGNTYYLRDRNDNIPDVCGAFAFALKEAAEIQAQTLAALIALYEATPDNEGDTPLGRACVLARSAIRRAETGEQP